MHILSKIKAATESSHRSIESEVAILFSPSTTREDLRRLLIQFYTFVGPQEETLLSHLRRDRDPWLKTISFLERVKTPALIEDLRFLGCQDIEISALSNCPNLPALSSDAERLGYLYVLEGSTLGGRIISQQLRRTLHLGESKGLKYFSSYGHELGGRWNHFTKTLVSFSEMHPCLDDALCFAALDTFEKLQLWLHDSSQVKETAA